MQNVASTSLVDPQWAGTTVLHGDLATAIGDLKAHQDGTLLVPGSGALVRWLLANDLVDQLDLLTYPVVVGQGKRLFPDTGPDVALDLVNSRTTSRGITIQTYRLLRHPEYATSTVDPEHVMRDATSGRRSQDTPKIRPRLSADLATRRSTCRCGVSHRVPDITLATDQEVGRHRSLTFDVDLTSALEPVRPR